MLTLLTALIARRPPTAAESVDRDPGVVALLSAMVGAARRGIASAAAGLRASHQRAEEAALFSSSSAWPYNHRSN